MTDDGETLDLLLHAALAGAVARTSDNILAPLVGQAVEAMIAAGLDDAHIGQALRRFAGGTGLGWDYLARAMSQHWGIQPQQPQHVH
jgi:hypothetical protein